MVKVYIVWILLAYRGYSFFHNQFKRKASKSIFFYGFFLYFYRNSEIWTHDLHHPKMACYQIRYAPFHANMVCIFIYSLCDPTWQQLFFFCNIAFMILGALAAMAQTFFPSSLEWGVKDTHGFLRGDYHGFIRSSSKHHWWCYVYALFCGRWNTINVLPFCQRKSNWAQKLIMVIFDKAFIHLLTLSPFHLS